MSIKMKGLLKGLRYISQIFDEEKEPEIQIGYPTDVKHVAHIGWDGPSVDSPSWMKDFKSPGGATGDPIENPEIKWVSEDSSRSAARRDMPELPKSSRRHSSSSEVTKVDSPSKSRHSRRHHSKDSDSRPTRQLIQDPNIGSGSPSRNLPDIPKKSRRKKSKDMVSGGSTRASRSKGKTSTNTYTSPFSDPGPDPGSISRSSTNYDDDISETSSMRSLVLEDEKGSSGVH